MAMDFAKAKRATVVGTTIGAAYAPAITEAEGHFIEVRNGTDKDVLLKTKNLAGEDVEIILPTQDFSMRSVALFHKGDISIKHNGAAPTTGTVILQSICMGS